jgi:hypothetical protein
MSVRLAVAKGMRQYWPKRDSKQHVFLHIGTPKTGTTSIQTFLGLQKEYLQRNGFALCPSPRNKPNFKELFHASVLPSRRADMILAKPKGGYFILKSRIKRHILQVVNANPDASLVASTEVLSWLRHPSEVARLKELFPAKTTFTVILCLRAKEEFIASYKRQLDARKIPYGTSQGQRNYVEKDSWLLDYDGIRKVFETLTDDIRVIDYEKAKRSGRNIIQTFCETIGILEAPEPSTLLMLNQRSAFDFSTSKAVFPKPTTRPLDPRAPAFPG